ncbi:MAG: hypothetical protein M1837_003833 [Sclerophora amabilis]|nr:MAG: hypothetical protein M1837_003833 [Sclerophora amabilis]
MTPSAYEDAMETTDITLDGASPSLTPTVRRMKSLPPLQTTFQTNLRPPPSLAGIVDSKESTEEDGLASQPRPNGTQLRHQRSRNTISRLFSRSSKPTTSQRSRPPTSRVRNESPDRSERPHTATTARTSMTAPNSTNPSTPATPFSPPSAVPRLQPNPSWPALNENPAETKSKAHILRQTWRPPPLFQAYPQSTKHSSLTCPSIPVESILRVYQAEQGTRLKQEMLQNLGEFATEDNLKEKERKGKAKGRRKTSGLLSKMTWSQKIFVLATSGYLLQYSGDGAFDRLPEKILKLEKDSVAFASDVLPGKPWVLQVSQVTNEEGVIALAGSRSGLSRLTLRGARRKHIANVLLVLESADEMDSWMLAVREQIEAAGGKKARRGSDSAAEQIQANHELHQKRSHRLLVKRNPNLFSAAPNSGWNTPGNTSIVDFSARINTPAAEDISPPPLVQETSYGSAVDTHLTGSTVVSDDHVQSNKPQEWWRLSYVSSRSRSLTASSNTSADISPIKDHFEDLPTIPNTSPFMLSETWVDDKRQSTVSKLEQPDVRRHLPDCECDVIHLSASASSTKESPVIKKGAPMVRNFSVPISSNRFSTFEAPPLPHTSRSKTSSQTSSRAPSRGSVPRRASQTPSHAVSTSAPDREPTEYFNNGITGQTSAHLEWPSSSDIHYLDTASVDSASSDRLVHSHQLIVPSPPSPTRLPPAPPLRRQSTSQSPPDYPLPPLPPPSPLLPLEKSQRPPIRRPASMLPQSPTFPLYQPHRSPGHSYHHSPRTSSIDPATSTARLGSLATSVHHQYARPKQIKVMANRKSMPLLAASAQGMIPPPTMPPPNCPLPLLPSETRTETRAKTT